MHRSSIAAALAAGAAMLCGTTALAAPAYVNGIAIDASIADKAGDRLGMFSDIYYDPNAKEWYGLSDRGPGGGTLPYDTRVQRFSIDVNQTTGAISNFKVKDTVKFTDPNNLLGAGAGTLGGAAPSPSTVLGRAFDPEGIVINPKNGNMIVSDEYGPSVYEFNRQGELLKVYKTPANILPRNAGTGVVNYPNSDVAEAASNNAGKRLNRGFEGLAISPDGKYAYAMLQSAMLDEGAGSGVNNRIVKFDTETGEAVAQYAYRMEGSSQGRGISALVALNNNEFLVLERNNRGVGTESELTTANKKVFTINLTGATDVTNIDLDSGTPFTPVTKNPSTYIDLALVGLTPSGGVASGAGTDPLEKWEGLAIGPTLLNGKHLILAGTDNDYSVSQIVGTSDQKDVYWDPTLNLRIRCDMNAGFTNCVSLSASGAAGAAYVGPTGGFSLIPGVLAAYTDDLVGYVAPIPEPETLALFGAGLLALYAGRRRKA